jgi:ABC-type microcin C transport system duplicated ATPase subunit YejF
MEEIRGNAISMIFQEPMTSLNPLFHVGHQIAEAIAVHQGVGRQAAMRQGDRNAAAASQFRSRSSGRRVTRTRCPAACASA